MTRLTPELQKKINELSKLKHKMTEWESHPKGSGGAKDYGGFMEGIEYAISKNWDITEKRIAIIEKLYGIYVLGNESSRKGEPVKGNESSFQIGNIGGIRGSEGWRITIDTIAVGNPINRETAYTIGTWLQGALESIKALYKAETDGSTIDGF